MKELSIEQKAKRYDEAKYIMKEYLESGNAGVIAENTIRKAFPELMESEDERIRKDIVTYLKSILSNKKYGDKFIESWISWLEKQGEKPADKVEPKFKQGDIIKEKETGNLFYVNSIEDFGYTLHYKNCTTKGCTMDFKYEDNYELVEEAPVWSREDERRYKGLHNLIYSTPYCDSRKEFSDWLESLKDRVQPQNLTVTDEELAQAKKGAYNDALDKIEYHSGEPTFDDGWDAAIWYLKKRIEKFVQQAQRGEF
jgi:hypothetical protein